MTEDLKFNVGDKVLAEVEIVFVDDQASKPYRIESKKFLSNEEIFNVVPLRPNIPQAVMDWYENCEDTYSYIANYFNYAPTDVKQWLSKDVKNEQALATLIAYGPDSIVVDNEVKYSIRIKGTNQYLSKENGRFIFREVVVYAEEDYYDCFNLTKQEVIEAGFDGVFKNSMFEVNEVG